MTGKKAGKTLFKSLSPTCSPRAPRRSGPAIASLAARRPLRRLVTPAHAMLSLRPLPATAPHAMWRHLGELAKLPSDSALRVSYEKPLTEAEALLKAASKQSDQAATSFALQRSQLDRFTLSLDQQRLVTHGSLLVLLKSKAEADDFYWPTSTPPGEPAVKETQAPAAPQPASAPSANGG